MADLEAWLFSIYSRVLSGHLLQAWLVYIQMFIRLGDRNVPPIEPHSDWKVSNDLQ